MDIKVKQRVVGALVLIGLVAIILPIIFHGNNVQTRSIVMTKVAPPAPAEPEIIIEANDATRQAAQTQEVVNQQQPSMQPQTQASKIQTTSVLAQSSIAEVQPALQKPQPWLIQVASFKEKTNALALQKQLAQLNIQTYLNTMDENKQIYYRLLSGPYAGKQQAQAILQTLKKQARITGILSPFN